MVGRLGRLNGVVYPRQPIATHPQQQLHRAAPARAGGGALNHVTLAARGGRPRMRGLQLVALAGGEGRR